MRMTDNTESDRVNSPVAGNEIERGTKAPDTRRPWSKPPFQQEPAELVGFRGEWSGAAHEAEGTRHGSPTTGEALNAPNSNAERGFAHDFPEGDSNGAKCRPPG
jgi:hypothetical protein